MTGDELVQFTPRSPQHPNTSTPQHLLSHSQRLILDRSEFDYRFVFLGRKVVKEIVDRIHVLFVDKHFIVQVGGGGSSGIADIPDQFATLHVLALAYRE